MQVEKKETGSMFERAPEEDRSVEELEKEFLLLLQGKNTQAPPALGLALDVGSEEGGLHPGDLQLDAKTKRGESTGPQPKKRHRARTPDAGSTSPRGARGGEAGLLRPGAGYTQGKSTKTNSRPAAEILAVVNSSVDRINASIEVADEAVKTLKPVLSQMPSSVIENEVDERVLFNSWLKEAEEFSTQVSTKLAECSVKHDLDTIADDMKNNSSSKGFKRRALEAEADFNRVEVLSSNAELSANLAVKTFKNIVPGVLGDSDDSGSVVHGDSEGEEDGAASGLPENSFVRPILKSVEEMCANAKHKILDPSVHLVSTAYATLKDMYPKSANPGNAGYEENL